MNRCISFFLSGALILGLLASLTGCQKASEGLEFKSLGDGTCAVIGIGTCEDEDVVIPKKSPDGDTVTEIADEAFKEANFDSIVIPNTVERIGTEAFCFCDNLRSIDFGKGLTTLGYEAFSYCTKLQEIKLPDSFTTFEIFTDDKGALWACSGAFEYCESLTKVTLPANVKAIYGDTFTNCPLEEVVLQAELDYAIYTYCYNASDREWYWYFPSLHAEKPDFKEEIYYMNEDRCIKMIGGVEQNLYAYLFGEDATVNGEEINPLEPTATEGNYISVEDPKNYSSMLRVENKKITFYNWNEDEEEYVIGTTWHGGETDDETYDFEWKEKYGTYVFEDQYDDTNTFIVLGEYLLLNYGDIYIKQAE